MNRFENSRVPHRSTAEVVRRVFNAGGVMDAYGQRYMQLELSDANSTVTAYAHASSLPEINRLEEGDVFRCHLLWQHNRFPQGWNLLAFTRQVIRGEESLALIPRTLCASPFRMTQFSILLAAIRNPALRHFMSDVFADRVFILQYFRVPDLECRTYNNATDIVGDVIKAISLYWYAPRLTTAERDFGAVALLFARPGENYVMNPPSSDAGQRIKLTLPELAVRNMRLDAPRIWRALESLWVTCAGQTKPKSAFTSPYMRLAFELALAHALATEELLSVGECV